MDTHKRSIAKSITFRIVATIVTIAIVLTFTGNLILAGAIGTIDLISKLMLYYAHERAWENFSWGKRGA